MRRSLTSNRSTRCSTTHARYRPICSESVDKRVKNRTYFLHVYLTCKKPLHVFPVPFTRSRSVHQTHLRQPDQTVHDLEDTNHTFFGEQRSRTMEAISVHRGSQGPTVVIFPSRVSWVTIMLIGFGWRVLSVVKEMKSAQASWAASRSNPESERMNPARSPSDARARCRIA